jgi:HJR/Mrr/RecB family endonuclease
MPRRRNNPIEEGVSVVVGLVVLLSVISPQFRAFLLLVAAVAALLVLGWIVYRLSNRAEPQIHTMDFAHPSSITNPVTTPSLSEKMRALDWFQFEKLIAAVYHTKGYMVKRLGGANPDGGVDLIVEKSSERFAVQCKQWKAWKVGVRQIREFLGTLTDSGIPNGIFITLQGYTDDAKALADKHNITLLSEVTVVKLLEEVHWKFNPEITSALDDTRKFCPRCERELVLRTAGRGSNAGNQFWGCSNYPRCRFILNISEH